METTTNETLTSLSAVELAAMIARGDISAVEAVEAHIARIERVNPVINAVVVKRYDAARAEAKVADERRARGEPLGPLHGVPITIKESLDLVDTPSTFGLPSRARLYATLYNVLGYPTGIIPFTRVRASEEVQRQPSRDLMEQAAYKAEVGSAGLPVGVQVVARPWREHVALAAMRAIEEVACTYDDYPGIVPM